jgi:hypothetical protein
MKKWKFNLGDTVKDVITGFTGVVTCRSEWLNNCNTYGVQPTKLKDGIPQNRQGFDEPQLELVKRGTYKFGADPGGPERTVVQPNR